MGDKEEQYQDWIGKSEFHSDLLTTAPMEAMSATLDKENTRYSEGDSVPALWHWLYFHSPARHSSLAIDGHPAKGSFLPPIDLPRRMWAGSRFEFRQALKVGQRIERTSTIKSIKIKQGRSGKLAFVCVAHEISGEDGLALLEEHDIVYRQNTAADAPAPTPTTAPEHADFSTTITPDPVLLFRYSALTFNGHRIHYDRDYVTKVEGYPGLIVHGPLLATLLVDLLAERLTDWTLNKFEFRAMSPVFDLDDFTVCGLQPNSSGISKMWIKDHNGSLCMQATATLTTR